ncbi:MAG: hypothetical protein V1926_03785 [Candidatus Peregrinibacteria bacterium]
MNVREATDQHSWDTFLSSQQFRPFLQSWTMGEVYRDIGEEPVRLEVRDDRGEIAGICQAIVVRAKRGWHLAVPYGPILSRQPSALRLRSGRAVSKCLTAFWESSVSSRRESAAPSSE